jgi:RNA polymerase sigma factor (sigma-70 family)
MTEEEESWQRLIQGLRTGDRQIMQEFWEAYGFALERLAEKHVPASLRRRFGPEDVAQSVCRTFLRRVRCGEFEVAGGGSLWRLLCAITLTKVREQARFHLRKRRGIDREVSLRDGPVDNSGTPEFQPKSYQPTPAEAALFADQFQHLIGKLNDEERQVVEWKLQECTSEETARHMGCSERTVRRILKRVQARWTRDSEGD